MEFLVRGMTLGTNEYPFLIDEQDFSVLPITSLGLKHEASQSAFPRVSPVLIQWWGCSCGPEGQDSHPPGARATGTERSKSMSEPLGYLIT
jgi:hypothetical protein